MQINVVSVLLAAKMYKIVYISNTEQIEATVFYESFSLE